MMTTKTFAIWMLACAVGSARPGDLDRNFKPELRAWVAPDHVTLAADGRAWIGGSFDRGDGYSTGDLVRLGENGVFGIIFGVSPRTVTFFPVH